MFQESNLDISDRHPKQPLFPPGKFESGGQLKVKHEASEKSTGVVDLEPDYEVRLSELKSELEVVTKEKGTEAIRFGPTYRLETKSGRTLSLPTIFIDYPHKNRQPECQYFVLALDEQGNIVGDRRMMMRPKKVSGSRMMVAEGMVATGLRGGGIALPIEVAHLDFLQKQADRFGMEVGWYITNFNLTVLNRLEKTYRQTKDPKLLPLIEQKRAEQARWQALYGPNGKLGFDEGGAKFFQPNKDGQKDLEAISQVELAKIEDSCQPVVLDQEEVVGTASKEELRQDNLEHLSALLGKIEKKNLV